MRRLSKKLEFAVAFARFCDENRCEPSDLARAIQYADLSASAYAREDFYTNSKYMDMFKEIAQTRLNCHDISWPGLYPMFKDRSGRERMLPD
jgi:hypothetical protein